MKKTRLKRVLSSLLAFSFVSLLFFYPNTTYAGSILLEEEFDEEAYNERMLEDFGIDMEGEYDEEAHNERFLKMWEELYGEDTLGETYEEPIFGILSSNKNTLSYYVSKSSWITRSGTVSLSVHPKTTLTKTRSGNESLAVASKSFDLLRKKHGSNSRWKNTNSMRAQWDCHVLLARDMKTPWNLEPHRTTTSLPKTIKAACNPRN